MSDDLVKRLRETTHMYQVDCELKMKCADRIEELEAKLAKAMEALDAVMMHDASHFYGPTAEKNMRASWRGVVRKVRPIVAELKKENPTHD